MDPDILLMDEAFSALDPLIRTEMQDELLNLQEQDQRTIVFINHDLNEALRIGDRWRVFRTVGLEKKQYTATQFEIVLPNSRW